MEKQERWLVVFGCVLSLMACCNKVAEGCLKADAIYAGEKHSVLMMENESIWSCGDNYYGQLGIGSTIDQSSLMQVLGGATGTTYLTDIVDVAPGTIHTVVLDNDGTVWSYGSNCYIDYGSGCQGILGNNDTASSSVPVQVLAGEQADDPCDLFLEDIVTIGAGRSGRHSLAVDTYGYVWTWGSNVALDFSSIKGQLGHNSSADYSRTPVQVHSGEQNSDPCHPHLEDIVAVTGGSDHSMGLEDPCLGGRVYCWGANYRGQLGNGEINSSSGKLEPVAVLTEPNSADDYLEDIRAICAGARHSMALDANGNVLIWGMVEWAHSGGTDEGTLGNGSLAGVGSTVPVYVRGGEQSPGDPNLPLSNIIAISAGAAHSMALDSDGHCFTWGDNQYGQLGIGESSSYVAIRPVKVHGGEMGTEFLEHITAIAAGYGYCLALDEDGIVWS